MYTVDLNQVSWGSILSHPCCYATWALDHAPATSLVTASQAQGHGAALEGRTIQKQVQGKWFEGTIRKFKAWYGTYKVHYPEDSNKEDMSHEDIVDSILPERTAAANEVNDGALVELVNCIETHSMSEDEDMQVM